MSDFLGHLVARSLDLSPATPAVRPRLASRFEPVTPAVAPLIEETMEEVVSAAAPAARIEHVLAEPAAARPAPHPPGPPLPSAPPTTRERGEEALSGRSLGGGSPLPVAGRADGRGAGGEGPPPPPQVGPVIRPLRIEEGRSRPEPALPPSLEPTPRAPIPVQATAAPPFPEPRPQVEPVIRRIEVERVLTPASAPPAPAPSPAAPTQAKPAKAAPAPVPAPPILQPRVQAVERGPFPARREEPAAEPVIHVTIGRIEVRATPAPKAPARERQAARPAVDLEEYLRQRAQGEGR